MNRCPITYENLLPGEERYSAKGMRRLSPSLKRLGEFPLTAQEQRREALRRATKMSIQGVQPKLSARLAVRDGAFRVVDRGGRWILKMQTADFPHVPENEDLTMRLAAGAGIPVPVHGLLWSRDGSLTYFIRRFDRTGRNDKLAVEDFAQLAGRTRDTKYDFSMEGIVNLLDLHAMFPAVEKLELFRRTLFGFLTGNEDMHLKNFSLLTAADGTVKLSPAYDLLNSTIALPGAAEEMALPLKGKKRGLTRGDLVEYFGRERLGLPERAVASVLRDLARAVAGWETGIRNSFLPAELQAAYTEVVRERTARLGL
ncbi:HipA domain-containing protein [bacterium]|nr:HipA domain-containing protein [bacterium]